MPDLARPGTDYGDEYGDAGHLLELLARRPAWHADGACREHPEISWFPAQGQPSAPAKAVCAECLVVVECRAWAAGQTRLAGIWGGLSEHDRRSPSKRPRIVARCTRCDEGVICDACQERSAYRRKSDAELFPATAALLARLA